MTNLSNSLSNSLSLAGKTAIVTGAGRGGRGIGRGIAVALAEAGADVVITARTNIADAEAVVEAVNALGRRGFAVTCDVADAESVEQMVRKSQEVLGHLDILVNNAGITKDTLLLRMDEAAWDSVIDTNLKGTFLCTRAVAKVLLKQKTAGRIISITSVMGLVGNPGQANYSASKAGIIGFTRTVARELGSRGITVNAIAPGFIETQMTDALPEAGKNDILRRVPLARLGTPEDVGAAAAFLASAAAGYITGQVLTVDGGMTV